MQSFARIQLPGISGQPIITLENHETFMAQQMARNLTPGYTLDPYTSHHSAPVTLSMAIKEMVLRDKIDVAYNPRITARRRQIEWPSLDAMMRSQADQCNGHHMSHTLD